MPPKAKAHPKGKAKAKAKGKAKAKAKALVRAPVAPRVFPGYTLREAQNLKGIQVDLQKLNDRCYQLTGNALSPNESHVKALTHRLNGNLAATDLADGARRWLLPGDSTMMITKGPSSPARVFQQEIRYGQPPGICRCWVSQDFVRELDQAFRAYRASVQ